MRWLAVAVGVGLALSLVGCLPDDSPRGLRPTPDGPGARVVFDRRNQPLPDIPFPNDLVTRPDNTSPTGIRLNLSLESQTAIEQRLREESLSYDGFGTFSAITVRFDAPIDFRALDGRGRAPADDPVLLVNVSPGAHFGERVELDLGRGDFPATVTDPGAYFLAAPNPLPPTLLFETVDEDLDRNDVLSPREDLDGDGALDRPNVARPGDDPDRALMTWYELQTDTLILRPVEPLRPGQTYAVVITEAVRDAKGAPVRSPFAFIHHTQQTKALERLEEALAPTGVSIDDIAFTWTFTTATSTELDDVRAGLDGVGALAALAEAFPPNVDGVDNELDSGAVLVPGALLSDIVAAVAPHLLPDADPAALAATFDRVGYLVSGRFTSPDFLAGPAPRFDFGGAFEVPGGTPVPFWCVVPQAAEGAQPPFPVVLFAHDHRAARFQSLLFAGTFARWGFATCAIDAVGQGVVFSSAAQAALDARLGELSARPFRRTLGGFRARDLNNDGRPDPGGDTFTVDLPQTRDVVRQTVIDWLQFVRVLRGFDGTRRWRVAGIDAPLAGDFDADGVVDLGGPAARLHFTGIGYGGMIAVVVAGVDGQLASVAPIAAGGGFADLVFRGGLPGMRASMVLPTLGPLVAGFQGQGVATLSFVVDDLGVVAHADPDALSGLPFAELRTLLVPGDRVVLTNLRTNVNAVAVVDGDARFRVAVPSDALTGLELAAAAALGPERTVAANRLGGPLRVQIFDIGGRLKESVDRFGLPVARAGVQLRVGDPLVAPGAGWGIRQQSPELRRFSQILQIVLDPVDPINYARRLAGTNTAIIALLGDPATPTSTSIALARAAGLIDAETQGGLVDAGVVEGLARHGPLADPDNLSEGTDGLTGPRWDPPLRATRDGRTGQSGLRFVSVSARGSHELHGPDPDAAWDSATYVANLLGRFFTGGRLDHDRCLATGGCVNLP